VEYGFKVTQRARRDLQSIWRHISRDNVPAADRFCDRLLLAAESLQSFPHRHGALAILPGIRKVAFETYLIFYEIDDESHTVEILRFWHGARDQRRLRLKEESGAYAQAAPPVS
jgi:plasmid stabilization system protein ParE